MIGVVGVDPLVIAGAALVAKAALEGAGKKVGESAWRVLSGVGAWLRDRFSSDGDDEGIAALDQVEEVPDSATRVNGLAELLEDRLARHGESFRSGLQAEVDKAGAVGGEVGAFVVNVMDQARVGKIVQIGVVNTDTFNV